MEVKIEESWKKHLQAEFDKPYFATLTDFVRGEYAQRKVYPPAGLIFNAFNLCPFDDVRVVLLGQDPYHEPGQAHGLCFSVRQGIQPPPSLVNIMKEVKADVGVNESMFMNGSSPYDLTRWASQGVLLLNATLTVREHQAGSHQGKGWETFTDAVIKILSEEKENVVFILWGSYAQSKRPLIDESKHLVLTSVHPSPLSAHRGFFGNHHFSLANRYLQSKGKKEIVW